MTQKTKLIFVVGASRSGTTMLSRILGNNTQITALKELHYFGDLFDPGNTAKSLSEEEIARSIATLLARQEKEVWHGKPTEKEINLASKISREFTSNNTNGFDLFERVATEFAKKEHTIYTVEHTPRNIYYASQILQNLPNAFIIFVARDPRAVLASQKKRWRRKWLGGSNTPWKEVIRVWVNYHPITMSKLWNKATNTALKLKNEPRFKLIRFEDIVETPEIIVKNICNFLDVDYEANMLSIPQIGSSNRDNLTSNKGIAKDVVNQWNNSLNIGELVISEHLCGQSMQDLRYTTAYMNKKMSLSLIFQIITFPIHILGVLFTNPRRAYIQLRATVKNKTKS